MNSLEDTNLGRCSTSPAQAQSFETLPSHFIPWHPLPTQHSPRYLRCSSFLSCRVACSSAPHTTPFGFFSWGTHSPGLPSRSRRRHVPLYTTFMATAPLWSRPSAGPARVTWQPPPPAAARLLAHPAPATGPAWPQRIPQDLEPITVRLPWGTGHGKGPCSPKVVPVTPPAALTDTRSRYRAPGPRGPA